MRIHGSRGGATTALFGIAALLLVSACSGDDGPSQPEPELQPRLSLSVRGVTIGVRFGEEAPSPSVELANPGTGPLVWTASDDADWLTVSPASGTVAPGQSRSLNLVVNLAGLTAGRREGIVTVTAAGAEGSPSQVDVSLVLTESAPTVSAFAPAAGATEVGIETAVLVTFAEAIDPASLTAETLVVEVGAGTRVDGTIAWDPAIRTATFTPTQPLTEFRAGYAVKVEGVRGLGGTPMAAAAEAGFTTVFVDPGWLYRLHNEFQGPGFALDNFAPGAPQDPRFCYMADATTNTSGSFWYFEPLPSNPPSHMMKSTFGGADLALEGADGVGPCLLTGLSAPGSFFTGQAWTFPAAGDPYPGAYRLQNLNFGAARSLDVTNTGAFPELAYMPPTGNFTGQFWYFTRALRR